MHHTKNPTLVVIISNKNTIISTINFSVSQDTNMTSTNPTIPSSSSPPLPGSGSVPPPPSSIPSATTASKVNDKIEPEASAVLAYLKKRGLGSAALELEKHLDESSTPSMISNSKKPKTATTPTAGGGGSSVDVDMMDVHNNDKEIERKIEQMHESKSLLNLATGGGMGYDLDTASEILIWGSGGNVTSAAANSNSNQSESGSNATIVHIENKANDDSGPTKPTTEKDKDPQNEHEQWQHNEGIRYIRAFTALQTWVLTLPNHDDFGGGRHHHNKSKKKNHPTIDTVLYHAKRNAGLIDSTDNDADNNIISSDSEMKENVESSDNNINNEDDDKKMNHDSNVDNVKDKENGTRPDTTAANPTATTTTLTAANNSANEHQHNPIMKSSSTSLVPKSIKPELLSLCFPLLIHTYCNLLQSGLVEKAQALLATYRHIHEPYHPDAFLDLDKCNTQSEMKKLMSSIKGFNDTLSKAKNAKKLKEVFNGDLEKLIKSNSAASGSDNAKFEEMKQKIMNRIKQCSDNYKENVDLNAEHLRQLKSYPFLRRARSVKWHIHLSSLTFQTLVRFFHSCNSDCYSDEGGALLPMSGILQSYCHLIIESRDPAPFIPGFILEDMVLTDGSNDKQSTSSANDIDNNDVKWAAPVDMTSRLLEAGEDVEDKNSILKSSERLPFPDYYLKPKYATMDDYEHDKNKVEFNRSVLTNGFRRLEALETKREYEAGVRLRYGSTSHERNLISNPMEPSIMFNTICASSSKVTSNKVTNGTPLQYPLIESSIDLTCAKLCLPDGRNVAAGCTDSAVRIWSMKSWSTYTGKSTVDSDGGLLPPHESTIVLMGHKKGLPVYSIDWNRDGRTLLSAGGDGTIRLWDSGAVGPFGKLASVTKRSTKSTTIKKQSNKTPSLASEPDTHVPGAKPQTMVEKHGAALACYKGHARTTPIWSVAMAPCGYYFASAGSDSTARLWCTDRPTPVRIFMGHHSQNVNCLSWHPNCNYLLSGSDDKTIRMWDVQSGRCVRILSGCKFGVNQVKVSPSGQYVAGADYGGIVSIWDIRNGRKLDEFQHENHSGDIPPIIHSMSYSPCGSTIATGGEDCVIRIWDAKGLGNKEFNPDNGTAVQAVNRQRDLVKTFYTSGSMILDLEYTKRNLLLSVGKYSSHHSP